MTSSYTQELNHRIAEQLMGRTLFGDKRFLDLIFIAFISRGHVLIEGPPGTGKTHTAKLLAASIAKSFKRIQFTTDLLPSDILGANIYVPAGQNFQFIPGPIFSDFIVADEINRAPPRTQSALLEAMEERQVTIEGKTYPLSRDFFVVATQNPQDYEGTFQLPEVQMDRFLFKLVVKHAGPETEVLMLQKIAAGELPPAFDKLPQIAFDLARVDEEIKNVRVDQSLMAYITQILDKTRSHPVVSAGSSIRGGIALLRSARVHALIAGRNFVVPDDVKALAVETLRHRVKLSPEAQVSGLGEEGVIAEILKAVPFPK